MNFFKLYIGDYQRDTAHLSVTEHGAYLLMLQHHYATEKPLPKGQALHRMLRAASKQEREAVDSIASMFWTETEEGIVNERALKEIAKADHQRSTNREIGKRGGRPRKTDSETDSVIDGKAINNPNHNQTPDSRHQTKDQKIDPTGLVNGSTVDPSDQLGQTNVIGIESKQEAKQRRLSQITDEAIETYNLAPFTKKNGGEAKNADPVVGLDKRREQVKRVLKTASEICQTTYGSPTITREFWVDYWASVNADPFKSGREFFRNSEHPNWKPSFEYLTRVKTMLEVFDSAMSEDAA